MPKGKKKNPAALYFPDRIQKRLSFINMYPLTILAAPSGFGKSLALKRFLRSKLMDGVKIHILDFAQELGEEEKEILKLLEQGRVPETFGETCLILESMEKWELKEQEVLLQKLSAHDCPQLHIAAVTSCLDRGKLSPDHRICLLGPECFAFTEEETGKYMNAVGDPFPLTKISELYHLTNGWIQALYLMAAEMIQTGSVSSWELFGLIRNKLWKDLSPEIKNIFLSVSLLENFSLRACCILADIPAEEMENFLWSHAAFLKMGDHQGERKFFPAFQDFLEKEFSILTEKQKKERYLMAAECAVLDKNWRIAVHFYYLAEQPERIFQLPVNGFDLAETLDHKTAQELRGALKFISPEIKISCWKTYLSFAGITLMTGGKQDLYEICKDLSGLAQEQGLPLEEYRELHGELAVMEAIQYVDDGDRMMEKYREAWQWLQKPTSMIGKHNNILIGSPSLLYLVWKKKGTLSDVENNIERQMTVYYCLTDRHSYGLPELFRAETELFRGNFQESEYYLRFGMLKSKQEPQENLEYYGQFIQMRIFLMTGNKKNAMEIIRLMKERMKNPPDNFCRNTAELICAFYFVLTGNEMELPRWIRRGECVGNYVTPTVYPFAWSMHAKYLLSRREYLQLIGAARCLLAIAEEESYLLLLIYGNIYLAQAEYALGNQIRAADCLKKALGAAEADGVFLPFAENFRGLREILAELPGKRYRKAFNRIREMSENLAAAAGPGDRAGAALSPREVEVYQMARQGMENSEIAETLGIQISTVKNLFSRIYKKMGVKTKLQLLRLDMVE